MTRSGYIVLVRTDHEGLEPDGEPLRVYLDRAEAEAVATALDGTHPTAWGEVLEVALPDAP